MKVQESMPCLNGKRHGGRKSSGRGSKPCLQGAIHFAAVLFFLKCSPLVVLLFASAQADDYLGVPLFIDKHAQRHDAETGRTGFLLQGVYFLAVEQQFAVAPGGVVIVRAEIVFGDVGILHPQFAIVDVAKSIHQAGFSGTDAFYFGAGKDYARRVLVYHQEIVLCTFVLDVDTRRG